MVWSRDSHSLGVRIISRTSSQRTKTTTSRTRGPTFRARHLAVPKVAASTSERLLVPKSEGKNSPNPKRSEFISRKKRPWILHIQNQKKSRFLRLQPKQNFVCFREAGFIFQKKKKGILALQCTDLAFHQTHDTDFREARSGIELHSVSHGGHLFLK